MFPPNISALTDKQAVKGIKPCLNFFKRGAKNIKVFKEMPDFGLFSPAIVQTLGDEAGQMIPHAKHGPTLISTTSGLFFGR